jgi:hypothetical protein
MERELHFDGQLRRMRSWYRISEDGGGGSSATGKQNESAVVTRP